MKTCLCVVGEPRDHTVEFIHQPVASTRLGDFLKTNLSRDWTEFRAAVAFVKRSGTKHIAEHIHEFAQNSHVEIIVGINHCGTSADGLMDLLGAVKPDDRIFVFHNLLPFTFHPKIYLFKCPTAAEVLIGSGNLTEGGLFTNYEATLRLTLDLTDPDQASVLESIEHALDEWSDISSGLAHVLDHDFLEYLISAGLVPSEAISAPEMGESSGSSSSTAKKKGTLDLPFIAASVPAAPPAPKTLLQKGLPPTEKKQTASDFPSDVTPLPDVAAISQTPPQSSSTVTHFFMTLQKTDVGVGQTTAGTSRRSPEIFIPLAARDAAPDFWGWPTAFTPDPARPGKMDRVRSPHVPWHQCCHT